MTFEHCKTEQEITCHKDRTETRTFVENECKPDSLREHTSTGDAQQLPEVVPSFDRNTHQADANMGEGEQRVRTVAQKQRARITETTRKEGGRLRMTALLSESSSRSNGGEKEEGSNHEDVLYFGVDPNGKAYGKVVAETRGRAVRGTPAKLGGCTGAFAETTSHEDTHSCEQDAGDTQQSSSGSQKAASGACGVGEFADPAIGQTQTCSGEFQKSSSGPEEGPGFKESCTAGDSCPNYASVQTEAESESGSGWQPDAQPWRSERAENKQKRARRSSRSRSGSRHGSKERGDTRAESPSSMGQMPTHPQQKCGAIILSKDADHVLLVKGIKSCKFGFAKGEIKDGESEVECAARECKEEIGMDIGQSIDARRCFRPAKSTTDNAFFVIQSDLAPIQDLEQLGLHIDEAEIAECRWFSRQQLEDIIESQPASLIYDLRVFVQFSSILPKTSEDTHEATPSKGKRRNTPSPPRGSNRKTFTTGGDQSGSGGSARGRSRQRRRRGNTSKDANHGPSTMSRSSTSTGGRRRSVRRSRSTSSSSSSSGDVSSQPDIDASWRIRSS